MTSEQTVLQCSGSCRAKSGIPSAPNSYKTLLQQTSHAISSASKDRGEFFAGIFEKCRPSEGSHSGEARLPGLFEANTRTVPMLDR